MAQKSLCSKQTCLGMLTVVVFQTNGKDGLEGLQNIILHSHLKVFDEIEQSSF
jgi:hypothetical protein